MVEKMPGQVDGGLAAKDRLPSCPQAGEVEIARARDLVLQFAHWRGHQAARRDFVLAGRVRAGDAADAFVSDLLRQQRQPQLLSGDAREEAAHGVLLPSRRLHDRGDGRPLRPAQQRDDLGLFGIGATSSRFAELHRLARFC
jgi:hypothetical protein